jgi:DNA-directed RNA polymerase specialized sigma subunit
MELLETASDCIKGYDKSKGAFLNLFNSVMKKNMFRSKAKEAIDKQRRGLTLSQKDNYLIRKILTYIKSKGADVKDENTLKQLATYLKLPIKDVEELILINLEAVAINSTITNNDGDEIELFDLQLSKDITQEEKAIQDENLKYLLEKLDGAYMNLQVRTKPVISKLLTAKVINSLEYYENFDKYLKDINFIDVAMVESYKLGKIPPIARQVAEEFGLLEASVSRTFKTFIEKLRE